MTSSSTYTLPSEGSGAKVNAEPLALTTCFQRAEGAVWPSDHFAVLVGGDVAGHRQGEQGLGPMAHGQVAKGAKDNARDAGVGGPHLSPRGSRSLSLYQSVPALEALFSQL